MSAHTPGPWEADRRGGGVVRSANPSTGVTYARGIGRPQVALVIGLAERPEGEWEANTRLIAAAPDLLGAVEKALSAFDVSATPLPEDREAVREARAACRAAIAKARGGK